MKRIAGAALAATLALTFAACNDDSSDGGNGGDGGDTKSAPTTEEFCKVATSLFDTDIADDDYEAQEKALGDYVDDMFDVGVPAEMPGAAQKGLEVMLKVYDDASASDLADENFDDELQEKYKDDEPNIEAYQSWFGATCAPDGGDGPSASVPTDVPSSPATDMPSQ